MRAYLGWKHHEAPRGEYLKSTPSPIDRKGNENSQERAYTVKAYLGWKHHEALE